MPASTAAPVPARWRRRTLGAIAVLAVATVAAACSDDAEEAGGGEGPTIVATTSIWADVVANVACGDLADVVTLIPPGGDPHRFEPSLADRERMDRAALVVANGLLLEEGLEDTIDEVEDGGVPVFRIAEHVDTIPYGRDDHADEDAEDHADEDEHGHDHEGADPHVWFDPRRVGAALPELAEHLVQDAGLDAEAVDACLAEYQARLAAVDAEVEDILAVIPEGDRVLVTNHEALGYFADRYGFEVIGTVIPAPSGLAETNPAQLEELAEVVEAAGVPAIFAESQHTSGEAEALADRVGDVAVVTLFTDTVGEAGSGAETYLSLLRTDAMLVADALS